MTAIEDGPVMRDYSRHPLGRILRRTATARISWMLPTKILGVGRLIENAK
jgi:hypothetical protein